MSECFLQFASAAIAQFLQDMLQGRVVCTELDRSALTDHTVL